MLLTGRSLLVDRSRDRIINRWISVGAMLMAAMLFLTQICEFDSVKVYAQRKVTRRVDIRSWRSNITFRRFN